MDISDLSPKEKLSFEQFENLWEEGTGFYWRVAILLFFFWQMIDIILTVTFSSFGGRVFGNPGPNIPFNMNSIAQLWGQVPAFFMAVGFMFSWMGVKEAKRKKLVATLIIIIWATYFTYIIAIREPWIKDTLPRQIAGTAEFLSFLGITIFLAIKVKWPRFIWVVTAYLGSLLILYYGFYRAITLALEWSPTYPHSFSTLNVVTGYIFPILGIISAIFMAWASSEKGRRWATFSHILEERKKAGKRQA